MLRYSLRQLEYFVLAAREGSVVRAAERLNVSQPSVSAAISKLEDQLGVQLLIRHHAAGVSTTPAGAQVLAQAQNLLQHATELQDLATSTAEDIAGELHLASFVTIAPLILPGLIDGFNRQHGDARVHIHEATQDNLLEGLRMGRFELALLYDLDLPDDLKTVPLTQSQPYVLMHAEHRLMAQDAVELQDLRDEQMILLDVAPSRTYFLRLMQSAGVDPKIAFSSSSMELVRGLVGKGQGYSLLVTRPHGDVTYDGEALGVRPISGEVEPGRIVLASLGQLRPTRLMQAFTDYCIEHFSTNRPDSAT